MNMKKIFKRTSLLLATALIGVTATVQAQKSPQDMDRFVDALMRRMTVEEKIGQLNLPVTGEITTGQAKSSDVAKKIEQRSHGGGFGRAAASFHVPVIIRFAITLRFRCSLPKIFCTRTTTF